MIDYLKPAVPASLPWHETPLVHATDATLEGFGRLVEDLRDCTIEIVRWPAAGRRPVDPGTGDQGGTARGAFEFWCGEPLVTALALPGDDVTPRDFVTSL